MAVNKTTYEFVSRALCSLQGIGIIASLLTLVLLLWDFRYTDTVPVPPFQAPWR
jgi:hypothetical protein